MRSSGNTTVWGAHIDVARPRPRAGWRQQLKAWWAARRQANMAALEAAWDARREAVKPRRADAAPEMAVMQGALSTATLLYGLSL
jgi:hypothetical protein